MLTDARKSELCLGCAECCKALIAFWPEPRAWADRHSVLAWLEARGVVRRPHLDLPGLLAGEVRMRCPHLGEDNRCGIYESRPRVCREFDGLAQPGLDCAWRAEC